jgi:hypothetical protein
MHLVVAITYRVGIIIIQESPQTKRNEMNYPSEKQFDEVEAEYLKAYPKLSKNDFAEAQDNIRESKEMSAEDYIYNYACQIEEVAKLRCYIK